MNEIVEDAPVERTPADFDQVEDHDAYFPVVERPRQPCAVPTVSSSQLKRCSEIHAASIGLSDPRCTATPETPETADHLNNSKRFRGWGYCTSLVAARSRGACTRYLIYAVFIVLITFALFILVSVCTVSSQWGGVNNPRLRGTIRRATKTRS